MKNRAGTRACLTVLPVLLAAASSVNAQRRTWFHLTEFGGDFQLRGEYRDERRVTDYSTLIEKEKTLREDLHLRFAGDIYHPRLLEYELATSLGLEQQWIGGAGVRNRSINSTNLGYDFHARILWQHPYSAHIYSNRQETRTRQTFFETTEATVTETGMDLLAKKWWIPSRLHYHHYTYKGRGLDDNDETRDNFEFEGRRFDKTRRLQYSIKYNDITISSFDSQFTDLDAFFSHGWNFGNKDQDTFSNSIRYREQNGDYDNESLIGNASLHFQWRENLSSDHDLIFDHFRVRNADTSLNETWRHTSTLTYELFSSLDVRAGFQGQRTDQGDAAINRAGYVGDIDYRKKTFFGNLRINYHQDTYWQNEQSDDKPVSVLDESHTYIPGIPLLLNNFSVDLSSIVITDATGLTVYQNGTDYLISVSAGRVRIEIPAGSRILPNQVILVDYLFLPRPEQRFKSVGQSLTFGFDILEFADIELAWSETNQSLLGGFDSGTLDDSSRLKASLALHSGPNQVRGLYENLDSKFTPFERWEFGASTSTRILQWLEGRSSATTYESRFKDQTGKERGTTLQAQLLAVLSENSRIDTRAEWRKIKYRTDKGKGFLFESNLIQRFRATEVKFQVRYSDEVFDVATDQRILYAMLSVARRF